MKTLDIEKLLKLKPAERLAAIEELRREIRAEGEANKARVEATVKTAKPPA